MRKLFLLICIFFLSASAIAGQISEIVFFGDSLSDDGNIYKKFKMIPKSPPYYQGRFSNGPTWAEHIGNHLYHKSYINYLNYAYGGATAFKHDRRTDKFVSPMLLQAELDSYFAHRPGKDKSSSLYALWIGGNDYLYETMDDLDLLTNNVINKIEETAKTLLSRGAYGIILLNLPDLSAVPYIKRQHTEARAYAISRMHNAKLGELVKKLETQYPNRIFYFDIYDLFTDLMANTAKYNLKYGTHITDITESCWVGTVFGLTDKKAFENDLKASGADEAATQAALHSPILKQAYLVGRIYDSGKQPCEDVDSHVFWDDLHPTAIVHQVLGNIMIEQLEAKHWI